MRNRVVVTGGRDFRDRYWLWAGLDRLHELVPITHLIEGGAEGADRFAGEWARRANVGHTTVYARWREHGRKAGYMRNLEMAEMHPDLVLAAPGGVGTEMMVSLARGRGLRVIYLAKMDIIRPIGRPTWTGTSSPSGPCVEGSAG